MRPSRRGLLALVAVVFALGVAGPAAAADRRVPIKLSPSPPKPLVLRGQLEDGELTATLQLRPSSRLAADRYYFRVVADLKGKTHTLGRERVTVSEPVDLPPGGARDFTVTVDVSGPVQPDVYRGSLQVVQVVDPRRPLRVPLRVDVQRRPAPTVVGSTPVEFTEIKAFEPGQLSGGWTLASLLLTLLLVVLAGLLGQWLLGRGLWLSLAALVLAVLVWAGSDRWLSDQLENADTVGIDLDNPVTAKLPVTNGSPLLRRDLDGRPAQGVTLQTPAGGDLADWDPERDRTVIVRLDPLPEHPGRYRGQLLLRLAGNDVRFSIPASLSVRVGPLVPLLVLLGSILGGYGVRRLVRSTFHRQQELTDVDELERRIEQLPEPERQAIANELAEHLIVKLAEGKRLADANDHEAAHASFVVVGAVLDAWARVKRMTMKLGGLSDAQRATAIEALREAEVACRDLKAAQANTILDWLEGRLWAWRHLGQGAAEETEPRPEAEAEAFAAERRADARWAEDVGGWPRRTPGVLRFLVLSVTQPAVYAALVVALAVAALLVLYVENPTFGAEKTDWLPLIGWGFATDPVSAALSSLRGRSTS
jgi:hypothetical protein